MSTEGYATFLELMGHRVRRIDGIYWFNVYPRIYMPFPFQKILDPFQINVSRILGKDGLVVRYPCAVKVGRPSYRIICDVKDYGLMSLKSKARNQTRRGLERCEVKQLDFSRYIEDALELNRDTLIRQQRSIPPDFEEYWRRYFRCCESVEGAEIWGAFVEEKLAAYLIAFRMENVSHILILRSKRELLKFYPNNALVFAYLEKTLTDDFINEVSIGFESIQEGMGSLDHFKVGMGFRKEPVGQRIEVRPVLSIIFKTGLANIVEKILSCKKADERFWKFKGLIRWYNEQPVLH